MRWEMRSGSLNRVQLSRVVGVAGLLLSHVMMTTAHAASGVPGDINDDYFVSCPDLAAAQTSIGKRTGQPGFQPAADIDHNGLIDIRDVSAIARLLPAGTNCNKDPNLKPVANAGPDQSVTAGSTTIVQLDGSGSADPEGHSLTYTWALAAKPAGSAATLSNVSIVNPTFVADKPGTLRRATHGVRRHAAQHCGRRARGRPATSRIRSRFVYSASQARPTVRRWACLAPT